MRLIILEHRTGLSITVLKAKEKNASLNNKEIFLLWHVKYNKK